MYGPIKLPRVTHSDRDSTRAADIQRHHQYTVEQRSRREMYPMAEDQGRRVC